MQEEISSKAYELFSKGKQPCRSRHRTKPKTARSNQIIQRILEIKATAYSQFDIQRDKW